MLVQFLAIAVAYAGGDWNPKGDLFPFDISGLGIQDGESPDKTILVAKIGQTALALQTPRSELIGMAQSLLLAASAPESGSRPN